MTSDCTVALYCQFSLQISVIADDIDSIAAEVSDLSPKYTHVITAGGIGPTHDDITFEGIQLTLKSSPWK